MRSYRPGQRILLPLLMGALAMVLTSMGIDAAKAKDKKEAKQYRTTQTQIQSQLMTFADSYAAVIAQATMEVQLRNPRPRVSLIVERDFAMSVSAALIIAASPNPEVGLLDMVVMVALGRMIYEEHWRKTLGTIVQPMVDGFKLAERGAWRVAATVLSADEQTQLRNLIRSRRRQYPNQFIFSFLRFKDFETQRYGPTFDPSTKSGGLFKSVKEATQKVDDVLLLAERGLYLGARLPLLANSTAQLGVLQLLQRQDIQQVIADLRTLATGINTIAAVTEKLPAELVHDLLAEEKRLHNLLRGVKTTLAVGNDLMVSANTTLSTTSDLAKQLGLNLAEAEGTLVDMAAIRATVKQLNTMVASLGQVLASPGFQQHLPDLLEEKRLQGVLTGAQQTFTAGNELIASANTALKTTSDLVTQLGLDQAAANGQPLDAATVSNMVEQLNTLVGSLGQLLESPGWEQRLPQLIHVFDRAEQEGEDFFDHIFLRTVVLMLMFLIGCILAALLYQYLSRRLWGSPTTAR